MANREYKSDVFSMLLEDKSRALELYNAMAGTDYEDPEVVEICTLEKGVSLTIKNDASFIINMDATLNIYEHQSTYNPNLPLRELIYFVTIIKDRLDDRYMYSRKLVKIPTPKFAVFYNGDEKRPEKEIFKLSSAFENQMDQPELELVCTVYNMNPGNNCELLNKCNMLNEYMIFIGYVKDNLARYGKNREGYDHAVGEAIDRCIEDNILKDFFLQRREEVQKAMIFDFTYEKQMENAKREWFNDGLEEGRVTKLIDLVVKKVRKGKNVGEIAEELEMDVADTKPIYEAVLKHAPGYDEKEILDELKIEQG